MPAQCLERIHACHYKSSQLPVAGKVKGLRGKLTAAAFLNQCNSQLHSEYISLSTDKYSSYPSTKLHFAAKFQNTVGQSIENN